MSSRQLEEMQERKLVAWLSEETGFSPEELEDHTLDEIGGNDGAVYGHMVTLADGRSANVGFPPEEPDYDD